MKTTILIWILAICGTLAAAQSSTIEKQLLDLVNKERAKAKLSKLEWSDKLAQAALAHSKLLEEHQDLSHQFAGELILQERVGYTGLRFDSVAENVAEAPDVATVHDNLMHSPGHRANILNPDYNAIGVSIVQHGSQLFVTEDFARVVSYSEKEFQNAVISAFGQMRRAKKLPAVDVVLDPRLRKAACAEDLNNDKTIQRLPGAAQLFVFSASEPGQLPDDLRKAAANPSIERIGIGVCLQTGGKTGFSKFWVVAAFYASAEDER